MLGYSGSLKKRGRGEEIVEKKNSLLNFVSRCKSNKLMQTNGYQLFQFTDRH